MHVRDLVEIAGVVAHNGPLIIHGAAAVSPLNLERYWATSKCRLESWHRALKQAARSTYKNSADGFDRRIALRATLDEIIVGEILTRVWSAVLVARDRLHGGADEPIARNVLVSHLEARHRALALLLDDETVNTQWAERIDCLRRRAERWTDLLVASLLDDCDVSEFAAQPERAIDFASDLTRRRADAGGHQSWRLMLVALRTAFRMELCPVAANPDANARITASILGCLPSEMFDSTGLPQSVWMMRMNAVACDAEGMIDDLLRGETSAPAAGTAWRRWPR